MRARWSTVRDTARTQLWPLPTVAIVLALAVGVLLPLFDAAIDGSVSGLVSGLLFSGGADAARTVLSAIAGSLITVTSLTFSLTVVTLQLASSQFSPRLLRTFTRDRYVHVTLGLFLATFIYALTVLRTVRNSADQRDEFVPQVSVSVAFLLAVASVLGLVVFLAHLARQIRVETMLRTVHAEGSATARLLLDEHAPGTVAAWSSLPSPPPDACSVTARSSGFLVRVDEDELLSVAVAAGAVVTLDRETGSFLVAGTPIAAVWAVDPAGTLDRDAADQLADRVRGCVTTGFERTAAQDVGFALRQLADVANKALSPGINDPTTAIHALGHSSALLRELAGRDLGDRVLCDDEGRARVVLHRPGFADLMDQVVGQPRRYGAADPSVLGRIAVLLREVAWCMGPDRGAVVLDQLARLQGTVQAQDFDEHELRRLSELAAEVRLAVAGRWPLAGPAVATSAPDMT